jgi:Ca2+-binding EF-hand superfamily protein
VKINRMFAWTLGAVLLIGMAVGITAASGQKTAGSPSGVKLWFSAMDTDHDGTVSKQEFMGYMGVQFDKADADHDGTLDKSELVQLQKNLGIKTKQ